MPGLTIGWEYLTGRCVATNPVNRQEAEWPPHPARVFMAMAAAWFETGQDVGEQAALLWLESLENPLMFLPPNNLVTRRDVVTVFVPVNDSAGPDTTLLQSAPTITRRKQPRTFPSVCTGEWPCFLRWNNVQGEKEHRAALDRLCGSVTRIGHPASLVRLWIADEIPSTVEAWSPDDDLPELQVRKISQGLLAMLEQLYNENGRRDDQRLLDQIEALLKEKSAIRGRDAKGQKAEIDQRIAEIKELRKTVDSHPPIRPRLGLWCGYRRAAQQKELVSHGDFDTDLLILEQTEGPRLPLISSLSVMQALRGAVMRHCGTQPIPSWVSGHTQVQEPLQDGKQHLAFLPMGFVGSPYADGHLLGAALAFPREVPRPERARALRPLLLEKEGDAKPIVLTLGRLGVWTLRKREWSEARQTLDPRTWTAHPSGAHRWASVTPVVLDRFPKSDRLSHRVEWEDEVRAIISVACTRIGLPVPVEVAIGTTSWHIGSPRALIKHRPLRPQGGETAFGEGFRAYPMKGTNASRPQIHVCLGFDEPVLGPVLIGAGRFLGYGLCKPLGRVARDEWTDNCRL